MREGVITRRTLLGGCSATAAALAIGCGDDGSGEDSAAGSSSGVGTGPATSDTPTTDDSDPTMDTGTAPGDTSTGSTDPTTDGDTTTGPSDSSGSDGDSGTSGGKADACDMMVVAAISENHGHALQIPLADIEAGVEVAYDVSGEANHCHEVVMTAADFETLQNGGTVTKFTCNGGDHQFVISCAPGAPNPVPPPECGGGGDNTGACP